MDFQAPQSVASEARQYTFPNSLLWKIYLLFLIFF
nr:MAG TPA: hypothetical protein [Caudoviricetes sp.]